MAEPTVIRTYSMYGILPYCILGTSGRCINSRTCIVEDGTCSCIGSLQRKGFDRFSTFGIEPSRRIETYHILYKKNTYCNFIAIYAN